MTHSLPLCLYVTSSTLSFYLPRREIPVHHSQVFQVTHSLGDLTADQQETLDADGDGGEREKMKNLKWKTDFSPLKSSFFSLSPARSARLTARARARSFILACRASSGASRRGTPPEREISPLIIFQNFSPFNLERNYVRTR